MTGPVRGPVTAWRLFTLDPGGGLVPPFPAHYWPDLLSDADTWTASTNVARCLTDTHKVPSPGCTCGYYGVLQLDELTGLAGRQVMLGGGTVEDCCDALARVSLHGLILESDDPADPPGSLRASTATLLDLFLPVRSAALADVVGARYGVPVTVLTDWPAAAAPEWLFWDGYRSLGLVDVRHSEHREYLWNLATDLGEALRRGLPRSAAVKKLFYSSLEPSAAEARAFVDLVIRAFVPEVARRPDHDPLRGLSPIDVALRNATATVREAAVPLLDVLSGTR